MNRRDYKQFAPETYYHLYNRGNGKQIIFLDDEDFNFFLFRLKESLFPDFARQVIKNKENKDGHCNKGADRRILLPDHSFDLICYCLMPNHYHFLIKQNKDISIAKLISKVCTSYSKYFNKKYKQVGHVFQDKFLAVPIDTNEYLLWLSAYIHNNPVTARLVKNISDYKWSSYGEYASKRKDGLCKMDLLLSQFKNVDDYINFVNETSEIIIKRKEDLKELLID